MPKVAIIGAGLAGSLLSIYLAKRGFAVDVFEARGDMRKERMSAGRSINMALSDRGIAALREVGMDEYMLREAIPMHGRMIHSPAGETKLLPYSGRQGEFINSISRGGLNVALMNEAEKYEGVRFHFNMRCVDIDADSGEVFFENSGASAPPDLSSIVPLSSFGEYDTVIATDGAGSAVRQAMERQMPEFQSSSVFLDHGYKELYMPFRAVEKPGIYEDKFAIEENALHIWPRHQFMMIALPNLDGSFTCTLFLAHKGGNASVNERAGETPAADRASAIEPAFDLLTDEASVIEFFRREFADALELMPTLGQHFFENPIGQLGTVKCFPWNIGGKFLLLGDAAHAVVPFYGQGMNCAFEDVRVLAGLIDEELSEPGAIATGSPVDWKAVYERYSSLRKPNTDAIADMAEDNFYEMRDRVADPVFQRKRELETKLEQTYPDYFSKYSMVTFREDLPYSEAKHRGEAQDKLLMDICYRIESTADIDLDDIMRQIAGL
ncbi:MAG: FAD-dependent monooxygenase [Acidobacteria bacterium]|nr:FAD-dependent monooxygenase [Acidobacteriota bacterium]